MQEDFNKFIDDLILEAANQQGGSCIEPLDFFELCRCVMSNYSPTWRDMAIARVVELELGQIREKANDPGAREFIINAAGISRASVIRMERRTPSFLDRIRAMPVGKGIWDIVKLGLAALLGFLAAKYSGIN